MKVDFIPLSEVLEVEMLCNSLNPDSLSNMVTMLTESPSNENNGFFAKIKRVIEKIINIIKSWYRRWKGTNSKSSKDEQVTDIRPQLSSLGDSLIQVSVEAEYIIKINPKSQMFPYSDKVERIRNLFNMELSNVNGIKSELDGIKLPYNGGMCSLNLIDLLLKIIQDHMDRTNKIVKSMFSGWNNTDDDYIQFKSKIETEVLPIIGNVLNVSASIMAKAMQLTVTK